MTNRITSADVVVVGSGLGGMVAAVRAHDLGMKVALIEKDHYYGGTSAVSGGGIWIPNHCDISHRDSREMALIYLRAVTQGRADDRKLEAYVDNAPAMVEYARSVGARFFTAEGLPDYFPELPGCTEGRQLNPSEFDAKVLGDEFFRMRMTYSGFLAFDRYVLNLPAIFFLTTRKKGWLWQAFKLVAGYWIDLPWRMKTSHDRRLSMGRASVGYMRKAMMERDIPLLLNTKLTSLEKEGDRIAAVRAGHNGNELRIEARAVILAAGGFDQNQEMRNRFHPVHTEVASSLASQGVNEGDAIRLGQEIGADIENMEHAWWSPTMCLPGKNTVKFAGQSFFDRGKPGSICVNRLGKRFCNESISYDRFGYAMIEDHKKTGANVPCWMIFDGRFRHNYAISNIMPGWARPDRKLPPEYLDNILYRANTIEELARKIDIPPESLELTITNFNGYAKTGKDLEFNRGETNFDRFFGDADRAQPNVSLGPIDKAPFYAIKLDLGDLGTKGGLRVDEHARVLDRTGQPIEGLYATGNTAGSLFLDTYPGGGGTLGPAMTFGFVSANHAAEYLGFTE